MLFQRTAAFSATGCFGSANRNKNKPGNRNNNIWFRLALSQIIRPSGRPSANPDKILTLEIQSKKSMQCRSW